ncbi:nicotinate-nucleotide--dimethylbenzimidazole phosphoribosyltransferase [Lachnospiraceae bacterium JLR.KK008]
MRRKKVTEGKKMEERNPYQTLGTGRNPDAVAAKKAREQWDSIAKPLYGLGRLEDAIVTIAEIQGTKDIAIEKRAVLVFCGDNGITTQGVTQTDSHVTAVVSDNIAEGKASVNRMCGRCGADVFAIDMGIRDETHSRHLISRKIRRGTRDFSTEPAMRMEEVQRAVDTGIDLVRTYAEKGYTLFAVGEMGIGNTTTAGAMAAALLDLPVEEAVGRGAGLSGEGLAKKRKIVAAALERYGLRQRSALEVLACVGGFDIAGMAGAFIGGWLYGVPVIVDGMISAVAALTAARLCPGAGRCMLASHMSREPGMQAVMKELALAPVIDASLALGEGTGAALLFPMLDMAAAVYRSEETFAQIQIESYQKFEEE